MTGFGTFFYPGPTEVRPEILAAQARPMIPHRGAAFRELFGRLQRGLQPLFETQRPVIVATSSATGLMEAAVRAAPAGPLLCVVHGAFSERFAAIAAACGREVTRVDAEWGTAPRVEEVRVALERGTQEGRPFAAITVVHVETSTGVTANVVRMAELARAHDVRLLVDSVTGVAGEKVRADAWGLDFVLTGSQKALAIPPGLAFGVVSERFMRTAASAPSRGLYLDVVEMAKYLEKGETPNTPAVSLLFALEAQLEAIAAEGLEARFARHARMAAMTHAWVDGWTARTDGAVRVLAPAGSRAVTVSAVTLPPGLDSARVVKAVAERGFTIGTGYGRFREGTFRIGHMGDHTPEGLERCLAACDAALGQLLPVRA
jgi:aspartate aminotransferase-like enzyme